MQNNKGKKEEEKSKKKLSAGEIAGIVIGSVAALALIIVLIVMLAKGKRPQTSEENRAAFTETLPSLSEMRLSPNNVKTSKDAIPEAFRQKMIQQEILNFL